MKIVLLVAFLGHVLCGVCDCLLSYNRKKRIDFGCIKDADQMAREFEGMPDSYPLGSILLGVPAIIMFSFGYFAISRWMGNYSFVSMVIMFTATVLYAVSGVAHHVIFSAVEWFYIRLGRTGEAKDAVLDFLRKTISTMFICYAGVAVFLITLIVAILTGIVHVSKWACLFNTLPLMLILTPTKLPAKGNIAGAIMFLGLAILI